MTRKDDTVGSSDPFNLARFTEAQDGIYGSVLAELRAGRKRSHWIWYIFPQMYGLGFSSTSKYYAIRSIEEARAYLDHPVLGQRLRECSEIVLGVEGRSASEIFGYPDDMKLHSSMTLFAYVAADPFSVFARVLDQYFHGRQDSKTLSLIDGLKGR